MAIFPNQNSIYQNQYGRMAFAGGLARNAYQSFKGRRTQAYTRGATQTMVTSRRRKKFKSNSFASKMLANTPAKHYSGSLLANLTHNTIYSFLPTAAIVQGDGNSNRDGDFITLAALKFKGTFFSATASNAYSCRILIGYSGEEYNLPTVLGTGLTAGELFLPATTGGGWDVNGIVNPKAFTSVYDETLDINSIEPSTAELNSFAFTVQLNRKFPYQSSASIYGKDRNLYVVVISSVNGGVAGTTSSGVLVSSFDLIFK